MGEGAKGAKGHGGRRGNQVASGCGKCEARGGDRGVREATVNGSQSQGLEGGERGRESEGFPQKRAGPRQTHDTVSDVTCHGAPQLKCRRQSRSGSDINSTQACHQNARRHVRHNCHANADWMSPSATHATQKRMGARGMDSRGARGGETEAMDRRGQDHARYAKVTSDVKQNQKRKPNVTRCHIWERRSSMCATAAPQQQRGCHLPACCRKGNGSQREGLYSA